MRSSHRNWSINIAMHKRSTRKTEMLCMRLRISKSETYTDCNKRFQNLTITKKDWRQVKKKPWLEKIGSKNRHCWNTFSIQQHALHSCISRKIIFHPHNNTIRFSRACTPVWKGAAVWFWRHSFSARQLLRQTHWTMPLFQWPYEHFGCGRQRYSCSKGSSGWE